MKSLANCNKKKSLKVEIIVHLFDFNIENESKKDVVGQFK